jgi:membrane fusion protein (multidrug efflux system)
MEQIDRRPAMTASAEAIAIGAKARINDSTEALQREITRPVRAPEIAAEPSATTVKPGRARSRRRILLMLGGILVVATAAGAMWLRGGRFVSTDNAYVRAAKLMVSTDVSGIVSSVDVHEGQSVKAGDILFRIDPQQFQIALDNAKANLAQMAMTLEAMKRDHSRMLRDVAAEQAQVELDQTNYDRYSALARTDVISKANYDQTRFTLAADKNKLESLQQQAEVQLIRIGGKPDLSVDLHPQYRQAKAQVDEAQRELDHAVVRAPFDGVVTQVDALQRGTYLVSQTAALTNTGAVGLVSANDLWVDANMKETDLTYVKPGDPVTVTVDMYPGQIWTGSVDSISPASGSEFSILPAQNSSGNWVKVVQRIPVHIHLDRKSGTPPLRSGMSVTATVDSGHQRTLAELL